MRTVYGRMLMAATAWILCAAPAVRADETGPKHDLKYKFTAGETIRTKIVHTSDVHTTIKNTHESASSRAESEKVWRVTGVSPTGEATFVYSVDYVVMRGKVGDYAEVIYDSRKDVVAPEVYKGVAKTIGTPISEITLDDRGRAVKRETKLHNAPANVSGGSVTLPMPSEPVAIGHSWYDDFKISVKVDGAAGQKIDREINARQRYKLESVTDGIARISVVTQVLDPALPAAVDVQLVQRILIGDVRFDIAKGRIVSQSMKVDGSVIDFHGAGSLMKCKMQIQEEFVSATLETASKTEATEKATATATK
ncbi:MAG: hypothetical protein WD875_01075 [Pirellulales bacterium]